MALLASDAFAGIEVRWLAGRDVVIPVRDHLRVEGDLLGLGASRPAELAPERLEEGPALETHHPHHVRPRVAQTLAVPRAERPDPGPDLRETCQIDLGIDWIVR